MTRRTPHHAREAVAGKVCSACREPRPLVRFLLSWGMPDGRVNRCLDCILADAQRIREDRQRRLRRASPQRMAAANRAGQGQNRARLAR
jgi:hypothetical protein